MGGESRRQRQMGRVMLGDDDEPGRVFVQTVDNARPRNPADAGKAVAAMGDEGVHERAGPVARRRMHHEARRFVNYDDVRILVAHVEGDVLAARRGRGRRRRGQAVSLARAQPPGGVGEGRAVAGERAPLDQRFQP